MAALAHDVMDRLNLGCGAFKKAGFINVDVDARRDPEVIHNLDQFPYPFPSSQFSLVEAEHVLEHLENPFGVMKELHRIMKDGGLLIIKVPHFSRGFTHADHKRGFDLAFPLYFDPRTEPFFIGVHFALEGVRLTWFAQPELKRTVLSPFLFNIGRMFGACLDFLANAAPFVCSRLWCYWVGGFEEMELRMRCVKANRDSMRSDSIRLKLTKPWG
jgi:SAM-dependent methyltransferase